MSGDLDRKMFSQIGILSYLKGKDIDWIIKKFKDEAVKLPIEKKHEIRQKILSSQSMAKTQSVTGELKVTLDHITYTYQDELSAVCLSTCKNYHQYHIRYVAQMISQRGQFKCQSCNNLICESTSQIILNAFVASYFQKIKSFEGSTLIFKKDRIGSMFKDEAQRQANKSQEKTVVPSKQDQGVYFIIQLKVLQIDNKDQRLQNINNQLLAEKLQALSLEDKSKQFEERELENAAGQILINLVCFKTNVRIRNPLIHKNCKPCDHKNRLILFSYEQVFSLVTTKKKKIECIFPSCSNYFDEKNFFQMAVVIENIHTEIYQEYKQCVFGQYFSGMYQKNWHFNYAENMLFKHQKNKFLVKRYMDQVRRMIQSLLTTVNLTKKPKIYKNIAEDLENNRQFDASVKLSPFSREEKIIIVDVDDSNLCPVRCTSCKNLNSKDLYRITYTFKSNPEKRCPICDKQCKKLFYDAFYLDLKQAQFLFLHGHNKQIYYDAKFKIYFHKLSFFTGRSMKQKLKQQNKVIKGNLYKSQIDIKLNKAIKYIPFMDRRCAVKAIPQQYNKHFIYIGENQKIKEQTICPHCQRQVRSDQLQYYEQLQSMLKANNNVLRWAARSQAELFTMNASILSIKYYNDIKNQYRIKDQRRTVKFYWKNYEGTLIRFPIKFRGCTHPIQTAVCDFSDILYQAKAEKATKFKCRWKQCKNEYSNAEQIERLSLDIYSKIEENPQLMRAIVNNNNYWIQYSIEETNIVNIHRKSNQSNDDKTELAIVQQYRNKYTEGVEERKNRKEIHQNLKKIEQEIDYTKQKVREDSERFQLKGQFIHSQNETDFQKLKDSEQTLQERRSKLLEQKNLMLRLEQEENRKLNKTNNINFTKLIKMYQPQVNNLKKKKEEEDPIENLQPEDFSNYRTYGNLHPFKYAVPKTIPAQVRLREVVEALQRSNVKKQNNNKS